MKNEFKERFALIDVSKIKVTDIRIKPKSTQNIDDLIEDIQYNGLIEPIVVQEVSEDEYILIAGYHRLQAHKALMIDEIKCMVRTYEKDVLKSDIDLDKMITKHSENHVRKTFTFAEKARDLMELHHAFCLRYPDYKDNPVKYIERFNELRETQEKLKARAKNAQNKTDKTLYENQAKQRFREMKRVTPPLEALSDKYKDNITNKEVELIAKAVKIEEKVPGFLNVFEEEKVPKTTINKIIEVIDEEGAKELTNANKFDSRAEIIEEYKLKADIIKQKKPIKKLYDGVYELGIQKTHAVIMAEQRHLIPQNKYNNTLEVKSVKVVQSALSIINIAHIKSLIIFYDKGLFNNFVSNFELEE